MGWLEREAQLGRSAAGTGRPDGQDHQLDARPAAVAGEGPDRTTEPADAGGAQADKAPQHGPACRVHGEASCNGPAAWWRTTARDGANSLVAAHE
jgi:hypothetical protein